MFQHNYHNCCTLGILSKWLNIWPWASRNLTQAPREERQKLRQMLQDSSKLKRAFKLDFCPTNAIAGQTQFYLETIKKKKMVTGKTKQNKQAKTLKMKLYSFFATLKWLKDKMIFPLLHSIISFLYRRDRDNNSISVFQNYSSNWGIKDKKKNMHYSSGIVKWVFSSLFTDLHTKLCLNVITFSIS